jgi:uncharacterized surface anchored protein
MVDTMKRYVNKSHLLVSVAMVTMLVVMLVSTSVASANTGHPFTNGAMSFQTIEYNFSAWRLDAGVDYINVTGDWLAPQPSYNISNSVISRTFPFNGISWGVSAFSVNWLSPQNIRYGITPPATFYCAQSARPTTQQGAWRPVLWLLDDYTVNTTTGRYTCNFIVYAASQIGDQSIASYSRIPVIWDTFGRAQLTKVSTDPALTNGNPDFSLQGAVFHIYTDAACTTRARLGVTNGTAAPTATGAFADITTGANGTGTSGYLLPRTYYVKEYSPSPGFDLNETIYTITVVANTIVTVNGTGNTVPQTPSAAQIDLVKRSANDSITTGNALYSLAGAEYGIYDNAQTTGAPLHVLVTDAHGVALPSPKLVLGNYWVKEIKAPPGFWINETVYPVTLSTSGVVVRVNSSVGYVVDQPYDDPIIAFARKLDGERADGSPQAGKTLAGAVFEIRYFDQYFLDLTPSIIEQVAPKKTWFIETKDDGFALLDSSFLLPDSDSLYYVGPYPTIPLGTLAIREISAPDGYILDDTLHIREITEGALLDPVYSYHPPEVPNFPERGDIELIKVDADDETNTLAGAVFEITRLATGEKYNIVTDADGKASTASSHNPHGQNTNQGLTSSDGVWFGEITALDEGVGALPYGQYTVREITPPKDFVLDDTVWGPYTITHKTTTRVGGAGATIKNIPEVARIDLVKKSGIESITDDNSLYSLVGAEYGIFDNDQAAGDPLHVLVTDQTGKTPPSKEFRVGDYWIKEIKAPKGYRINETIYPVTLRTGDDIVRVNAVVGYVSDDPDDDLARILLLKYDGETIDGNPQAGLTFEGVVFEVRFYTELFSEDTSKTLETATPERTWRFETDTNGYILLDEQYLTDGSDALYYRDGVPTLPLGTVTITEIKAPKGYIADDTVHIRQITSSAIREPGYLFDRADIANYPIRGDIEVTKVDAEDDTVTLAGAVFEITRLATGERYRIITGAGGKASTASSHNLHGQNTNEGLTDADGVWFGEITALDEGVGALPYGDYIVREIQPPTGYLNCEDSDLIDYRLFTIDETNHHEDITFTFRNYQEVSPTAEKYDATTGLPVKDTVFELRDASGRLLQTLATDAEGMAVFDVVPFGTYTLVEIIPNTDYATCEESAETSVKEITIDASNRTGVAIFSNKEIVMGTQIRKFTITRTSAAFRDPYGIVDNIGTEEQLYHIHYRNLANVKVDELTVIDPLEAVSTSGQRVKTLWSPVVTGDHDGLMNIWYKTNMTPVSYRHAPPVSAMATNEHNPNNPEKIATVSTEGWQLWVKDVPTDARMRLDVSDLSLSEDEYITALMFEHGQAAPQFRTSDDIDWDDEDNDASQDQAIATFANALDLQPVTYSVYYTEPRDKEDVAISSTRIDEARNILLTDWDEDVVGTRFIDTFSFASSVGVRYSGDKEYIDIPAGRGLLVGDRTNASLWLWTLILATSMVTVACLIRQSEKLIL